MTARVRGVRTVSEFTNLPLSIPPYCGPHEPYQSVAPMTHAHTCGRTWLPGHVTRCNGSRGKVESADARPTTIDLRRTYDWSYMYICRSAVVSDDIARVSRRQCTANSLELRRLQQSVEFYTRVEVLTGVVTKGKGKRYTVISAPFMAASSIPLYSPQRYKRKTTRQ